MIAEGTSLVTNHLGTGGVGYINRDLTVALARLPVHSLSQPAFANSESRSVLRPCSIASAPSAPVW